MHFVVVLLVLQCMWISTLACPEGWKYYTLSEDVPGNCYKAFNLKVSWEEADKQCKSYHKSNLVDLKDAKEQDYVKAIVKDNLLPALTGIGDGVWLGARQRLEDWQWVGGQTMDIDTFSWLAGNPDNGGWLNELSNEDCLEMKKTGLLNDYKCFEKRPFICKMSNIEVLTTRVVSKRTTTTERATEKNAHIGAKAAVGIVAGVICALLIVIVVAVIIRKRMFQPNLYDTPNAVSPSNKHLYDSLSTNKLARIEELNKKYSSSKQTSEPDHTYDSIAFSIL